MRVEDLMTRNPACCTAETTLGEVAQMMCDYDCGEIPVVDDEETMRPVGVITDRDITCRIVAQGKNPLNSKAAECMSRPCVTVTPDMSLDECMELLEEHQIRRVPVVDEEGRCCGIVSQADIAKAAAPEDIGIFVHEISQTNKAARS